MKLLKIFVFSSVLSLLSLAQGSCTGLGGFPAVPPNVAGENGGSSSDGPGSGDAAEVQFVKGADISWVTELENNGDKFYNLEGQERECTALMKELGLGAIRLRVWVDPSEHGNWCNIEDMVVKARRAAELGMDVMVDFHYSDWWADPGQQHKPASWKGLTLKKLKDAISDHTKEALKALKKAGVTPKWVQVGNEIRPGMLWDASYELSGASCDVRACDVSGANTSSTETVYPENWDNLAAFINVGYDAVKSVFPKAQVIVHLDNGYDNGLYTWFFDALKVHGGKWDIIGMSLYPYWRMLGDNSIPAETTISECVANINSLSARYDCDLMVVETGFECTDGKGGIAPDEVLQAGYEQLSMVLRECRDNTGGKCLGVFYWEPECRPSRYHLGAFTEDGHPTVIMRAFGEN